MLAEKAAARLVAEEKFEVDRLDLFFRILDQAVDRIVVQAPGLAWCAHELPVDVLIYMWRPDIEISNSIDRIKWDQNSRENEKMLAGPSTMVRSWSHRKIKWETRQHAICRARQVFTLDYHSLAGHPGWRDKSERANFHARQIQ